MDEIIKIVPTIMAAELVNENMREIKKKKKTNFVKLGMKNVVGAAIISETSNFLK
jgi:hypothetical protein